MSESLHDGGADDVPGDELIREMLDPEEAEAFLAASGGEGGNADGDGIGEALAEVQARLAEAEERLLRKAAEFENFRKRTNQEKARAIEFANESLLLDLIPVIDDLERAIGAAEAAADLADLPAGKAMLEGISMIEKRLTGQLEGKWGLRRFAAAGEPFDPNFHEAMFMEKSAGVAEPTVAEDFARGYLLKDRVIRAAKVKVLMPADEAPAASAGESTAEAGIGAAPADGSAEAGEPGGLPSDGGSAEGQGAAS